MAGQRSSDRKEFLVDMGGVTLAIAAALAVMYAADRVPPRTPRTEQTTVIQLRVDLDGHTGVPPPAASVLWAPVVTEGEAAILPQWVAGPRSRSGIQVRPDRALFKAGEHCFIEWPDDGSQRGLGVALTDRPPVAEFRAMVRAVSAQLDPALARGVPLDQSNGWCVSIIGPFDRGEVGTPLRLAPASLPVFDDDDLPASIDANAWSDERVTFGPDLGTYRLYLHRRIGPTQLNGPGVWAIGASGGAAGLNVDTVGVGLTGIHYQTTTIILPSSLASLVGTYVQKQYTELVYKYGMGQLDTSALPRSLVAFFDGASQLQGPWLTAWGRSTVDGGILISWDNTISRELLALPTPVDRAAFPCTAHAEVRDQVLMPENVSRLFDFITTEAGSTRFVIGRKGAASPTPRAPDVNMVLWSHPGRCRMRVPGGLLGNALLQSLPWPPGVDQDPLVRVSLASVMSTRFRIEELGLLQSPALWFSSPRPDDASTNSAP